MRNLILLVVVVTLCGCSQEKKKCGEPVEHQGYNYSTVQIGDQCWFSENCRYLPEVSPPYDPTNYEADAWSKDDEFEKERTKQKWINSDIIKKRWEPHYYVYDYQGTSVAEAKARIQYGVFGVLYNWPAVMTEDICPTGWHIPSDEEFTQLTDYLGGSEVSGVAMKSTIGWNGGYNGTNESGFNGLPGGVVITDKEVTTAGARAFENEYREERTFGFWWSSTDKDLVGAWTRDLCWTYGKLNRDVGPISFGLSARCVRD
jgi:uncharacterized protein (TIGR02145 family)